MQVNPRQDSTYVYRGDFTVHELVLRRRPFQPVPRQMHGIARVVDVG